MGGNSSSSSGSETQSVKLGNTTTSNPYVVSKTNNSGTTSNFQEGTALQTIYDMVNQNIGGLINQYLKPSLNNPTSQAKLNSFRNTLNNEMYKNLENNIVNPLAQRNMIRSSQATDLYNNASGNANSAIAGYANNLIANNQAETASIIGNLLSAYMNGFNVIDNNQKLSLDTSKSNATTHNEQYTNSFKGNSALDWTKVILDSDLFKSITDKFL